MAEVSKPDFQYVWASGGALVAPSNVKIQTGWTAEVPPFQWENWSQNRQDQAISHILQKGISVWSATGEYYFTASGERSYVQGSDGSIYVAVADSVNQNPVTDVSNTYWVKTLQGSLISTRVFTTSTTYTPTAGTRYIVVEAQGAGGAGGGIPILGGGELSGAGGGSSGAYGRKVITTGFSGAAITIGTGGSGVAGGTGGSGTTTSFGAALTCPGGAGAIAGTIATSTFVTGSPGTGSSAPTGADVGFRGMAGTVGASYGGTSGVSGYGASSRFGSGGGGGVVNGASSAAAGNPAGGYGAGGGGALGAGGTGATQAGGAGAPGIIIIYEYN